jgi:hypothetical protein
MQPCVQIGASIMTRCRHTRRSRFHRVLRLGMARMGLRLAPQGRHLQPPDVYLPEPHVHQPQQLLPLSRQFQTVPA